MLQYCLRFTLFLVLTHLPAQSFAQPTNTLHLGGTGAATGAMKILGKHFETHTSNINIKVFPSLGSGGGVRALLAGKVGMAFTSRPLKDKEKQQGLSAHVIMETPFVFVTHADVNIDNLSLSEIANIYSNERTQWPDGQLIRPVLRPEYDADSRIVMQMSPALEQAIKLAHSHSGKNVAATDFDSANELERITGSFGTTTTLLIKAENRRLNVPKLEGVAPTPSNYKEGKYPHGKTIYAILSQHPSVAAKAFLDFLKSDAAHKIIEQLDAVPSLEK